VKASTLVGALSCRFDPHSVVHRNPEFLLCIRDSAPLSGWTRARAETEFGLVRTGQVTETSAGVAKVMWRQLFDAGTRSRRADDIPEHLRRHTMALQTAGLVDRAEDRSTGDSGLRRQGEE
jgi:hypothetical protein